MVQKVSLYTNTITGVEKIRVTNYFKIMVIIIITIVIMVIFESGQKILKK